MAKVAWQYSVYGGAWSTYVDFSRNPGSIPLEVGSTSTAEYRKLIDGSEKDYVPEVKSLPDVITIIWPLQGDNQIFDLLDTWKDTRVGLRIRDHRGNIYEGYFDSVRKIEDVRVNGRLLTYVNTIFKRIAVS